MSHNPGAIPAPAVMTPDEPIAVIGMGCRFPGGADSPTAFWKLLCDGVDAISEVPADRWNLNTFFDPDRSKPGRTYTRWGGFINHFDEFDAHFFGISPREAACMDPQQRWLLEVSWEAMEDAGLAPEQLAGSNTGVFVGLFVRDYEQLHLSAINRDLIDAHTGVGTAMSIAANRISYVYDLVGPSVAVDTACSSSMVALHLACQSLRAGECTLALAGGVNGLFKPEFTLATSKASMLSPDGRSKSFDARANGYVRAEGAGMVVLKPLAQAQADGDPIYALIRGSVINQDGHSNGLTVPNGDSQEAALRAALQRAGLRPEQVQYAEAHGTGTPVGDPIESKAIGNVLGRCRPAGDRLIMGSVKSNIGHTESAAGVASLIKVALALKSQQIPPNLHFQTPNPNIPFDELQLCVPQSLQPWPIVREGPRLAAINSFGFGGANATMIVQEAPLCPIASGSTSTHEGQALVLPISARSPEALRALAQSYRQFCANTQATLADICYSTSLHRGHHPQRLALVAHTKTELIDQLDAFLAEETRFSIVAGQALEAPPKLAFVFAGMGPQWWAMGRQLLAEEPIFRTMIETCDRLLRPLAGWSLLTELTADEAASRINETHIAQPGIFAVQVGLAALWRSWGVTPDAIVGHSVGEVAAAYIAGALTLEDAIHVIYHRSRLQKTTAGSGKMLAVGLTQSAAEEVVKPYADLVSIAAINSPGAITLAGESAALEAIAAQLTARQQFNRFLQVEVPYHSPKMEPIKEELLAALHKLQPQATAIPLYSTATGQLIDGTSINAHYWWQNVRNPVRFAAAIGRMLNEGYQLFLEVSPHPVLTRAVADCLSDAGQSGAALASLRRDQPERATLLATAGALYTQGRPLDWATLTPGRFVRLPAYPWQRERYWLESPESEQDRVGQGGQRTARQVMINQSAVTHPLLGGQLNLAPAVQIWEVEMDPRQLAYLQDHTVQSVAVYPGAAYVEMALAAGKVLDANGCYRIEELEFHNALLLGDEPTRLQFTLAGTTFNVYSSRTGNEVAGAWLQHATGKLRRLQSDEQDHATINLPEIRQRLPHRLDQAECYQRFQSMGLKYGPAFQGIQQLWHGMGEALGHLRAPAPVADKLNGYHLHPSLLDACFQTLIGALLQSNPNGVYLPVQIGSVWVNPVLHIDAQETLWCHARLTTHTATHISGNLQLFDANGLLLLEVQELRCQFQEKARAARATDQYLYVHQWQPQAGAGQEQQVADFLPAPSALAAEVAPTARRLSTQLRRPQHYAQVDPQVSALCTAYIWQALQELGWAPQVGETVTAATLTAQLKIAAQHQRLLARLLVILGEDGLLRPTNVGWIVQRLPEATDPGALWQIIADQQPTYQVELTVLQRCGSNLAGVLNGKVDPLELIFPAGSLNAAEDLYRDGPTFHIYNQLVQKAVGAALSRLPADRTVRILEIGAGTGAMSSALMPHLPAGRTHYVFSDVSEMFTARAKQKLRDYPFVEYRVLDIEKDPQTQGVEAHSFDLILALDVLHATADLRQTLHNVHKLLAGNGLLIALEVTHCPRWFDLVFGLLKGWWRYTDLDLRSDHATLPFSGWQQLLHETGFAAIGSITDDKGEATPDADTSHTVILAQRPDVQPLTEPVTPRATATWLIFADQQGVGQQLAERLRAAKQTPVLVTPGGSYCASDATHYEIRPANLDDMRHLFNQVQFGLPPLHQVVHCWSLDMPPAMQALDQSLGCYSVLHLLQALGDRTPRLSLVTRGAQAVQTETLNIEQSPLWGMARVIAQEHPELQCTRLDLDPASASGEAEAIFRELWLAGSEDQVAWRQGKRHVLRLARYQPTQARQANLIKSDGSYLITGGLGGLGIQIAHYLVAQGARRLVLTGRSGARGKEEAVRQLEQAGAQVHVIAADIGDAVDVQRILHEIAVALPPLRGVIHAAGLLEDGVLRQQTIERFTTVMRPKIDGAWHLHTGTLGLPLDFFVCFSSLASLAGSPGQGNYSAANAFLDALAHQRRAQGLPALSINWGAWSQVGRAAQDDILERLASRGVDSITPDEGVAIFAELLGQDKAQIGVSAFNWPKFLALFPGANTPFYNAFTTTGQESAPVQEQATFRQQLEATAPREQPALLYSYLRTEMARVLRFNSPDQIKPRQRLFDLGLDSLMSVELRNRLEANLGVALATTLLFDYPTVEALNNHLVKQLVIAPAQAASPPAPTQVDKTEMLRASLDGLSQDDLAALLAQELASR